MATFAALRDSLDEFLTSHLDGLENEQRIEALGWYCQGLGFEDEAHAELDRLMLHRLLAECGGDLETVAQRLNRPVAALRKRLKALGIFVGGD